MRRALVLPAIAVLVLGACGGGGVHGAPTGTQGATDVIVDTDVVAVSDFGGFGAEWHPYTTSSSSAVTRLVKDRIGFMQLPFVRVRMFASWYADVNNHYDFSSADMQPLYQILDAARANGTDVVLTEWGPGDWSNDPWPIDDPRYAQAIADGLDHLIGTRGYTNIRNIVISNEPDLFQPGYAQWSTGIVNLERELRARGLLGQVRVTGPDMCCRDGWWGPALADLQGPIATWDRHLYPRPEDVRSGTTERFLRSVWDQVRASDPGWEGKPFFLGEAGFATWDQSTPAYAVDMADYAIQATRAGTSMMSAWMLDDESYPLGLDTEVPKFFGMWSNRATGSELKPWFYTWSLLAKLVRPGSTLYLPSEPQEIRALAARQPSTGAWTFVLVNREASHPRDVTVKVPGLGGVTYGWYLFNGMDGSGPRDADGFPLPVASARSGDLGTGITVTIPANSVVFITTRA